MHRYAPGISVDIFHSDDGEICVVLDKLLCPTGRPNPIKVAPDLVLDDTKCLYSNALCNFYDDEYVGRVLNVQFPCALTEKKAVDQARFS